MRYLSILLAVLLASFSLVYAQSASLFEISGKDQAVRARGVEATYIIKLNRALLVAGKEVEASLPIPDDPIRVLLKPIGPREINLPEGQAAWRGTVSDKAGGTMFLVAGRDWVRAQIDGRRKIYVIKSATNGRSTLEVIAQGSFPNDEPPGAGEKIRRRAAAGAPHTPTPDCNDDPLVVDIAVPYTDIARAAAGGTALIEAEVGFAVAQANLAYLNSGVNHRLNLVYTGEVAYAGDISTLDYYALLPAIENASDGVLDNINVIRDTHKADLVALIVENGGYCGLGDYLEPPSSAFSSYGYSLVQRSCAGSNLSLAHETGHNLAADHDRANADGHTSYNYNYGHIQPVPTGASPPWRTVMSYGNPCGTMAAGGFCARLPNFSNPTVSVGGDATGVAGGASPENNVMAINNAAPIVSKFRCRTSSTGGTNIWMKDRWEDAGAEPDPATAGQPMWESPYIWVRNTADGLLHQHEHQNPVFSLSTNHAYVKIQNDGVTAGSGELQLYWADASTDLNSPASWHLIAAQSVPTFASGTRVLDYPWASLPGVGHFCLMARWTTSPGSGLSFSNIDTYVRNNKTQVWRNLNILGSPDELVERGADVRFGGPFGGPETYLVFTGQQLFGNDVPWPKIARVIVTLDPKLAERAKASGEGLKAMGPGRFALTLTGKPVALGPILAPQASTMKVQVEMNQALAKAVGERQKVNAVFAVRVVEATKAGAERVMRGDRAAFSTPGLVAGGVTYHLTLRSKSGKDPTAQPPGNMQ